MLQKLSRQAAMVTLSLLSIGALSACSTNPYPPQTAARYGRPAEPLKLPPDADLASMERQYELVSRGLYLLPDGSVKPLPDKSPTPSSTQQVSPLAEVPTKPTPRRVTQHRPSRLNQKQRSAPANEAMVFDTVPGAVDITKGAGQ